MPNEDRKNPMAGAHIAQAPRLDAPARIGSTIFNTGVPWATVIGLAQREFACRQQDPCAPLAEHSKVEPLTGAFYLGGQRLDTSDADTLEYVRRRFEAKPKPELGACGTCGEAICPDLMLGTTCACVKLNEPIDPRLAVATPDAWMAKANIVVQPVIPTGMMLVQVEDVSRVLAAIPITMASVNDPAVGLSSARLANLMLEARRRAAP